MKLEEKIQHSETHQFRIVFPNSLNDNANLFGGLIMQWMDEVAYITALRFTRKKVVTVSVENISFLKAIKQGEMIEIIGQVRKVENVKLKIQVEVFIESAISEQRTKVNEALFVFAAINASNKPIPLPK